RNPLRERLWELSITALYRSGRQADALAAYQRLRRTLAEELGIAPSEPLRKLEQRVLLQDAALAIPTGPRSADRAGADETPVDLADEEAPPAKAMVRPPRWLPGLALALGVVALGLVWLGVASTLIAGLAVVCGTVAVRRTTTAHMSVDRLAVAGLVVGAVAFATSLGLLGYRDVSGDRDTVAGRDTAPGTQASPEESAGGQEVPISTLVVGDCIDLLPGTDPAVVPLSVLLVPCDRPHEQEVYHLFELAAGAYPGDQQVDALARDQCHAQFEEYVGIDPAWSGLDFIWVWPPRDTWETGNRRGGCSLVDALGHELTGSMAGSKR
ncbi:MAG TPA: BTAD domain-containing putative transcriptional regulator, partial [Acidimicrobiia bacterium]